MRFAIRDNLRRLRVPCTIGAVTRFSIDSFIAIIVLPSALAIAAINVFCSFVVFVIVPIMLAYNFSTIVRKFPRTKFFYLWSIWSMIMQWTIFQMTTPLMEILLEESIALLVLTIISIMLFWMVWQKAGGSKLAKGTANGKYGNDNDNDENSVLIGSFPTTLAAAECAAERVEAMICNVCRRSTPHRTFHCNVCQACILQKDHHNFWINCCIGKSNHRIYMVACVVGMLTLLFGANLSLTALCQPFLVTTIFGVDISLPENCNDVYEQYDIAIGFVASLYAVLIAFCILIHLIYQLVLISIGLTYTECRRGLATNRKGCVQNWKSFLNCFS